MLVELNDEDTVVDVGALLVKTTHKLIHGYLNSHTCITRSKESDFSNINPVNVRIRESYEDMNYMVE